MAATYRPAPSRPRRRAAVRHPEAGEEHQRTHPDALADPHRDPQPGDQRVVGPHREEIADVLMGDRPEAGARVPHVSRARRQPARVQVEVLLRVRRHLPRLAQQERDIADNRKKAGKLPVGPTTAHPAGVYVAFGPPPNRPVTDTVVWQTGGDGESVGWSRPGMTRSRKVGTPQGRVLANGQSR